MPSQVWVTSGAPLPSLLLLPPLLLRRIHFRQRLQVRGLSKGPRQEGSCLHRVERVLWVTSPPSP